MRRKTLVVFAATALLGTIACGDSADDGGALEECTPENAEVLEEGIEGQDITLSQCTLVTERIAVFNQGSVTVEPGSTVFFGERAGFWMQANSTLNAVGTADEPITFTGVEERVGFWRGLDYENTGSSDNALEYVTIEYAGYDDVSALLVRDDSTITVRNTTIRDSKAAGFEIRSGTDVLAFEDNTVTANAEPGIVGPEIAGAISASNDLSGNTDDWLRIKQGHTLDLTSSVTYRALGVPYLFPAAFKVFEESTWTVEPGVEILVGANQGIQIASNSTIVVRGTADEPIVIRGKEAAPGYWGSIHLEASSSANNALEHTEISDAGGGGDESAAAVQLTSGRDKTMRLAIDQVTIRDSAGHGFYGNAGYQGEFSVSGCDTVTFEGIAGDEFAGDPFCQ